VNDISMNFKMKKKCTHASSVNWYVRKKNIVITPQDEISLLLFYKKKLKSLLTSWLTFLLYNCSVNIPWKQPKKFFLALFSNFNQQQLLVKKTILYSSCQQAVFLFVKYYIFPLSFSQMKDEYNGDDFTNVSLILQT